MKNKLIDLNNHLFAQLERLSEEDLAGDKLLQEIDRSKAITCIANSIIGNAKLALDAQKALGERLIKNAPIMIGASSEETDKE